MEMVKLNTESNKLVALVDTSKHDKLTDSVTEALELINFKFNKEPEKIAIKPNMCYYWKSTTGETTNPLLVETIIDILRTKFSNPDISIVEADATAMTAKHAFRALGYEKLAAKKKVKLLNLLEQDSILIPNSPPSISQEIRVPKLLTETDLFISVPVLKLHSLTRFTCALKNQFGCIPVRRKVIYHTQIHQTIALVNKNIRPHLIVVDALTVNGKTPRKLNLIMASDDPVATDSVAAEIAGLDPRKIDYIVESEKMGVGSMNFKCVGEDKEIFSSNFPKKGFVYRSSRKALLRSYYFYLRHFTLEGKIFKKQPSFGS
jgi:uncharacterized protein (DUF362 family)